MKYMMAIDCESTKLPCGAVTEQGAKREATKWYADNYCGETIRLFETDEFGQQFELANKPNYADARWSVAV